MTKRASVGMHYSTDDVGAISRGLKQAIREGLVDWISVELEFAVTTVVVPPLVRDSFKSGISAERFLQLSPSVVAWIIDHAPLSLSAEFYKLSAHPTLKIDLSDGDTLTVSGALADVDRVVGMKDFEDLRFDAN